MENLNLEQQLDGVREVSDTPGFIRTEVPLTGDFSVRTAAHTACSFFGLKDLPVSEGESTGVYIGDMARIGDERLVYSKSQFDQMGWNTFEDQTKVWAHEIGHVILQEDFAAKPWAGELGADFFAGVLAEMNGIGIGNYERSLGSTPASETHPDGRLRLEAIQLGRDTVVEMRKNDIMPNWQNCMDKFKESELSDVDNKRNMKNVSFEGTSKYDDDDYNIKQLEIALEREDWTNAKKHAKRIGK